MTLDMIIQSQLGNQQAFLELVEKFKLLLRKYANLLNYEDAYNDLVLDFLVLIKKINITQLRQINEGSIIVYIQKSLKNCYVKRSKSNQIYAGKNLFFCDLTGNQIVETSLKLAINDKDEMENYFIRKSLKETEYLVIYLYYYYGFSVQEIAKIKNVSRQAINQTKKKALKKLQSLYKSGTSL